MNQRRVGLATLLGVLFLAFVVDPAAAQSTADTTTEELIWGINSWLLFLAIPIAVLVEGILIYTVWKYRKQDEPLPTRENRRLEITWTVATAIILVAVGIGSYTVLADPFVTASSNQELETEQDPIEIQVTAQKYAWTYTYPNETVGEVVDERNLGENATVSEVQYTQAGTDGQGLMIPTDRPVRFNITSTDWLHAFHVPQLGLKSDAFPGTYNTLITQANNEGEYQLYCAEYCGVGHSGMLGTVEVTSQEEFEQFLTEQTNESAN
ncbi:cytochrome c oxidase subunit II [Salinibaculum rarum]|uniref:cytochrome c oxidase subunit II n=1 Tax=Salinibaculum rarum TaxID=3058903 RepID=UPI00265DF399|nr:cytochrome c oxidase subunit II [Salinibaculum sp. KK48]